MRTYNMQFKRFPSFVVSEARQEIPVIHCLISPDAVALINNCAGARERKDYSLDLFGRADKDLRLHAVPRYVTWFSKRGSHPNKCACAGL